MTASSRIKILAIRVEREAEMKVSGWDPMTAGNHIAERADSKQ